MQKRVIYIKYLGLLPTMHLLLNISKDTLKAIVWDQITFSVQRSQLAALWCAILARHNVFDLEPPLCKSRGFTSWACRS